MWGSSPLLLKEKLGVGDSLLIVWCVLGVGFMVRVFLRLSYSFDDIFPFLWCVGVGQLRSRSLSEGTALCAAVHLVHLWEKASSEASYVSILVNSLECDVIPIPDIVYMTFFPSFWTFLRLSIYTILKIHDCISWCSFFSFTVLDSWFLFFF